MIDHTKKSYLEGCEHERINYLKSLAEKKTGVYEFLQSRVSVLITVSSIFLGAFAVIIDIREITDQALSGISFDTLTMFLVPIPFLVCLFITLFFISPTRVFAPNKKQLEILLYNDKHHRSVAGINKCTSKDEYREYIFGLSISQISEELIAQIYVVNKIIWNMQKSIKIAEIFCIVGMIIFVFYLIKNILT